MSSVDRNWTDNDMAEWCGEAPRYLITKKNGRWVALDMMDGNREVVERDTMEEVRSFLG